MDSNVSKSLAAARAYVARGIQVTPVTHRAKEAFLKNFQHLRLKENELPEHFSGLVNIGVLLGAPSDGLVDVDLDCPEALELAHLYLPPTPVKTGRASRPESHWWYKAPGARTKQHRDPLKHEEAMIVELRSTGVYTVVGPSIHPDGDKYDTLVGEPPVVDAADLALNVAALRDAVLVARYGHVPVKDRPRSNVAPPAAAEIREVPGELALRRASAYLDAMLAAISGAGGHGKTYAAATALVHGFCLSTTDALELLKTRYNPRCQPPWSDRELQHKVDDAATKPHDRPKGWLLHADRSGEKVGAPASSMQPAQRATSSTKRAQEPQRFAETDLGNAERLVAKHVDDIRYCNSLGSWFVWDGCRWVKDAARQVMHKAAMSNRDLYHEAAKQKDQYGRAARAKWARTSEARQRIEAAVELAKCLPDVAVRVEEMDADPWKLNVLNGTIDLKTGTLLPAKREDLITKLSPVDYDPSAECPLFMRFLGRILAGDADLIDFVQAWLGYCLTGDVTEQYLVIFFGDGNNGKSVLIDTIVAIMGEYAGPAPPSLLVESLRREHPTEIADLCGLRLVVASETEEGERLWLQLIKRITGDRQLKGRFMRQDFFTFDRTFKTIMITNNRPQIKESTEAAWRRLRIVPFDVVVPPEERDPKLMEKLKAEWPGILRFLVEGCLRRAREGLRHPAAVILATESFRESEDSLGRFYREMCVADANASVAWREIKGRYEGWASDNGVELVGDRDLLAFFNRKGHSSKQVRDGAASCKHRMGVRLRSFEPEDES